MSSENRTSVPNSLNEHWMPFTSNKDFKANPRLITEAKGVYLKTHHGKTQIDASSGLFCNPLGHGRKEITEAVTKQLETLDYAQPFQQGFGGSFELASKIAKHTPGDLNKMFFTICGSTAVETAIKIAVAYHRAKGDAQRFRFVGRERGYHGMNIGCVSVGGGGKGMKIVYKEEEFETLFSTAKSEAQKYFGNDEVYIEKFFQNPRHIEVQILAGKNNVVHLHERDCSVQRRHQKLIEETPSPVLNDEIRKDLFERTVKMVAKIGYMGAGTVEFIYEDGKFYFLEMNTRVQVEHPVTEMVTGIDIIKEQIWIAFSGETALKQSDINPRGHAIECRINAEDASKNFQPSPGTIGMCHQPSGFRTRVDGAIFQGYKVTPYYDSMVCKLICHGRNRTEAIQRMNRSLDEFVIEGITTTIPLHKKLLNHKKFINSDFNVSWLDKDTIV